MPPKINTEFNKKYFNSVPELNTQSLPIDNLDFSNIYNQHDMNLNYYPFVKSVV